jgi:DNA polymerase-3 subunit gamma/tau
VARTKASTDTPPRAEAGQGGDGYTVVARRYRPQRFEEVVGQDHVVQALRNAIRMGRVTHAYLFSGTRGVGKTSIARIFAKGLNCQQGPTDAPCNECDICRAISVGQDVDVIEIDGASNNGVEQVRELRQNAGLRPSRARFKIYYIDEVHMLSTGAFNALLKTLEEPPEHVKFFFATTEPNKIPETILSRCQRYDFAGIRPEAIAEALAEICRREGVEADREALRLVARRAAGSMRDAQSLLEQLLSSGGARITSELAHQALGLAPDERVLDLIEALADHDPARALTTLDAAVSSGVQAADLLGGAMEIVRDVMVAAAGAPAELLNAAPAARPRIDALAQRWPLDSVLATLQILSEARGRLRGSPHGRLLVELALCRAARLEDLAELGELVARLGAVVGNGATAASPTAPAVKKKPEAADGARVSSPPAPPHPDRAPSAEPEESVGPADFTGQPLTLGTLRAAWPALREQVGQPLGLHLGKLLPTELPEPGVVVIAVPEHYNFAADSCDRDENRRRIEEALGRLFGRTLALRFRREREPAAPAEPRPADAPRRPRRADELDADPLVQDVVKLFEARPVHVEIDDEAESG